MNALTGKKTVVVSDIPGTTRDATDTTINFRQNRVILVDTAGLRRRGKTKEAVEFYSSIRTAGAIERADIVWIVMDATEGLVSSDQRILEEAYNAGKGILLLMNKWDTITKDNRTTIEWERRLKQLLGKYAHLPLMFVSALKRQRLLKGLELSLSINDERMRRITTSKLNNSLLYQIENNPPPAIRGHYVQIKYITQLKTAPPLFGIFSNRPDEITDSYKRFLERMIREKFGFQGVPIRLVFRKK